MILEYQAGAQTTLYHIDCYRLKSEAEARAVGLEDYFYSGAYCFVEWAELIPSLLPENYVQVNITPEDDTHRTIEFSIHGRKEKDRV
ncbi:MAG: tRNA (adenosine(37)-N6)-threonylcarbamoyltransferase complex ATPase subunit type 1 TsaE [Cyclobacteriaceae bacterium]|nr:tRNA (adenosine(37)-N6)-threonylcarbamoyltransferase complex ATPase subunit type 1 TsaE [Cyclobacteriaceae bacterium]